MADADPTIALLEASRGSRCVPELAAAAVDRHPTRDVCVEWLNDAAPLIKPIGSDVNAV
jgi:hypothetical protein